MDHVSQAFIPGPTETKEEFEKRVAYCNSLRSTLIEGEGIPVQEQQQCLSEAAQNSVYGINPSWIPLVYSNHKLAPWHGGCAWIFQMDDQAPLGAFMQLRKPFRFKSSYLSYSRNELLAHEVCHIARMAFEEPVFEEHLAYRTGAISWRKWLGPIIRNSVESMFFFLSLALIAGAYLFALFVDMHVLPYIPYLYLLSFLLIGFGLWRLRREHHTYEQTLHTLRSLTNQPEQMMLWLTDQEIQEFGKKTAQEVVDYFRNGKTFRLQSLCDHYDPGITE